MSSHDKIFQTKRSIYFFMNYLNIFLLFFTFVVVYNDIICILQSDYLVYTVTEKKNKTTKRQLKCNFEL